MKVFRVIVDEIPERCGMCSMCVSTHVSYRCAAITDNETDPHLGADVFSIPFRRHDCPLQEASASPLWSPEG